METAELLQLMGKRWSIIKRLSEKDYYVIELAEVLGKKVPQASLELKELLEKGFVQCGQTGVGARKVYRLTESTRTILAIVERFDELKAPRRRSLEQWKLDELIGILEDVELSEGLRLSYAQAFCGLCSDHTGELLSNTRVRELLEGILKNPAYNPVSRELAKAVPYVLSFALTQNKGVEWVEKRIYPILLGNIKSQDKEIRFKSLKHIVSIALLSRKSKLAQGTRELLLNMYFSKDVEPDEDSGRELLLHLVELSSEELFKTVRYRAKSKDAKDRSKAERLLVQLRESVFAVRQINPLSQDS